MGTELNRQFSIEEYKMAERHIRKCSTSLAIREMQNKTILRLLSEWLKSKTPMTIYAGEDVDNGGHSFTAAGCANWYSHFGNQYGGEGEPVASP